MNDTHFANPHGYHDPEHYTSAYDVYLMAHEAMKDPTFRQLVSSVDYKIPATNLSEPRTLHSTNGLVSTWRVREYWYPHATGIKTGSTPEAGHCLVSSATKNDRNLIAVVMGAVNYTENKEVNYFTESKRLLEFGFNDFSRQTILDGTSLDFPEVGVALSETDYVTVRPAGSLEATLPNDIDPSSFHREIDLPETVDAPVEAGQKLGTVTLTCNGQTFGQVDLLANSSVERSELLSPAGLHPEVFRSAVGKASPGGAGSADRGAPLPPPAPGRPEPPLQRTFPGGARPLLRPSPPLNGRISSLNIK